MRRETYPMAPATCSREAGAGVESFLCTEIEYDRP